MSHVCIKKCIKISLHGEKFIFFLKENERGIRGTNINSYVYNATPLPIELNPRDNSLFFL